MKNLVENRAAFLYSTDFSVPKYSFFKKNIFLPLYLCSGNIKVLSTSRMRAEQWKLHHTGQTDFEFPSRAFNDFVKNKRKKKLEWKKDEIKQKNVSSRIAPVKRKSFESCKRKICQR